jgi:hypothetical protein
MFESYSKIFVDDNPRLVSLSSSEMYTTFHLYLVLLRRVLARIRLQITRVVLTLRSQVWWGKER